MFFMSTGICLDLQQGNTQMKSKVQKKNKETHAKSSTLQETCDALEKIGSPYLQ